MDKILKYKKIVVLHVLLLVYSISAVFSKLASREPFMSLRFIIFYGFVVVFLGGYAIGWQQVLKRMPLTMAYSNKAITVVWGIIWGYIIFSEDVTLGKIFGAVFIILGIVIFANGDGVDR